LKWAVTTGRYIIILTELVVIIAFLSRFKLDEDLRNVNEQIQTQVNFLESEQSQLNEFLIVQKRVSLLGRTLSNKVQVTEMMDYLASRTPLEIKINQLSILKNEISIGAVTLSESALGKMMTNMSRDGIWKSLDLTQIVSDRDNGIKLTIVAKK